MNTLENHILRNLPEAVYQQWQPHFQEVSLCSGQTLSQANKPFTHLYFPTSAIVSFQCLLDTGDTTEFAMVGRDGFVGLCLLLGGECPPFTAQVQTPGLAIRLAPQVVAHAFHEFPEVRTLFLSQAQRWISHLAQSQACRQHHSIEQQLSRLLLMILDRIDADKVNKTHEELGQLLGMRREAVNLTASGLKKRGLIDYSRGSIEVIDREGLERLACECYRAMS